MTRNKELGSDFAFNPGTGDVEEFLGRVMSKIVLTPVAKRAQVFGEILDMNYGLIPNDAITLAKWLADEGAGFQVYMRRRFQLTPSQARIRFQQARRRPDEAYESLWRRLESLWARGLAIAVDMNDEQRPGPISERLLETLAEPIRREVVRTVRYNNSTIDEMGRAELIATIEKIDAEYRHTLRQEARIAMINRRAPTFSVEEKLEEDWEEPVEGDRVAAVGKRASFKPRDPRSTGKCFGCKKKGHQIKDCPKGPYPRQRQSQGKF